MKTMTEATAEGLRNLATTLKSRTNAESRWSPKLDAHEPSLQQAAADVSRFVSDIAAGAIPYWLTLTGIPGSGKTMLARQIYAESKKYNPGEASLWVPERQTGALRDSDRRPYCIWLDATVFARKLKEGDYNLPESYGTDFLVVFDDLGASRDKTDFVPEAIYRLASTRLRQWTVWTTNLTVQEIKDRLDPRIASRLLRDDNKFITLRCGDYALRRSNSS